MTETDTRIQVNRKSQVTRELFVNSLPHKTLSLQAQKPESRSRPNSPINFRQLIEKNIIRITRGFSKHTSRERKKKFR